MTFDPSKYVPIRVHWTYQGKSGVYTDMLGVPYDPESKEQDDPGDEVGLHTFIWREGNYACDCNRGDFFKLEPPDGAEWHCGDTIEVTKIERIPFVRSRFSRPEN